MASQPDLHVTMQWVYPPFTDTTAVNHSKSMRAMSPPSRWDLGESIHPQKWFFAILTFAPVWKLHTRTLSIFISISKRQIWESAGVASISEGLENCLRSSERPPSTCEVAWWIRCPWFDLMWSRIRIITRICMIRCHHKSKGSKNVKL